MKKGGQNSLTKTRKKPKDQLASGSIITQIKTEKGKITSILHTKGKIERFFTEKINDQIK
jgi:hypothetical protein